MNNHGIARPKIRDIGAYVGLHSQSDSIESLSIVDGLCVVCQQFRHITSTPNISRSHHSSFGDLHQAASLGCALCQFILDQPQSYGYVENYTDEGTKWVPVAESLVDLYGFSHMLVRLEFAVEPNDPLAQEGTIRARSLAAQTSLELCASFGRHNLERCMELHDACVSMPIKRMPTRVINVSGSHTARLMNTQNLEEPWVALSYCWGPSISMTMTATVASIPSLMQGFNIADLPRTIHDAVVVTRLLGIDYLWVDALCIIQDDPLDVGNEIQQMRHVYKGSLVTITVDGAVSASEGFLGRRLPVDTVAVSYSSEQLACRGTFYIRKRLSPQALHDVLGSRGWSLQETLLSPRTLHIGRQQLYWNCRGNYCSEGNPEPHRLNLVNKVEAKASLASGEGNISRIDGREDWLDLVEHNLITWYEIINDYTKRSFSITEDIFPAIAGLTEEIQRRTDLTYAAGLWEQDAHRGLLWLATQCGRNRKCYLAPSWSWASLDLRQSQEPYPVLEFEFRDFIKEYESIVFCVQGTTSKFIDTPSQGSHLKVCSSWTAASAWKVGLPAFCNQRNRVFDLFTLDCTYVWNDGTASLAHEGPMPGQILCDFDTQTTLQEEQWSGTVFTNIGFLMIASNEGNESSAGFIHQVLWCLMLASTGQAEDEFRRVGVARVPRCDKLVEPAWVTRTIKVF